MMTPDEFARALHRYRYWYAYGDNEQTVIGELLAAYRSMWERVNETGPTSAVNEADSNAWELSRRGCECRDCKGAGNLPCDECGVTG